MKKFLQNWLEIPEKEEIDYDKIRTMVECAIKEAFSDEDEQSRWLILSDRKCLKGLLYNKIQQVALDKIHELASKEVIAIKEKYFDNEKFIDDIVERIKKKQL